jgi:hypothetical protein
MEQMIAAAEALMRSLCQDRDDWEYAGAEEVTDDFWGADRFLVFRRQDYVTCYVGFRGSQPLYVLQRIE